MPRNRGGAESPVSYVKVLADGSPIWATYKIYRWRAALSTAPIRNFDEPGHHPSAAIRFVRRFMQGKDGFADKALAKAPAGERR